MLQNLLQKIQVAYAGTAPAETASSAQRLWTTVNNNILAKGPLILTGEVLVEVSGKIF